MSRPKESQINLLHHRVLLCRTRLQRLADVVYTDGTSPKEVVPVCQSLLQPYVEALEMACTVSDAFVLPTDDGLKICGEECCDAHSAVLALTGLTLASVAIVVCSPPHKVGCVFDDPVQERFHSRLIDIMRPRILALFQDLSKDARKEKKCDRDPRWDEALEGLGQIGREHGLRKTMPVVGDVLVAKYPEVLYAGKTAIYIGLFKCFDEIFPQMEGAHIPVIREQLCFIKTHELSRVKSRLRRELVFAHKNKSAPDKIAPDERTVPMSYRRAARLMGKGDSRDAAEWLSASVRDGSIQCEA